MSFKKEFLIACTFLSLFSCTESVMELPEPEIPVTDRLVFIEDFTGVQCPNCPKGAATIEGLMATYPGKVTAVGIHGSFLTKPIPGESKFDFRNQFSKDLENLFASSSSKPSAMVDRVLFDGEDNLPSPNSELWSSYVEKELNKNLELNIDLTKSYDPNTRIVNIGGKMVSTKDLSGSFILSIFVSESGIIDAQEDGSEIILDYEHNHVLRHMMTKFDGDAVGSSFTKGTTYQSNNYTYTIPEEYDPAHMEIVFVISRNDINDKSILQAAQVKVVE